MPIRFDYRSIQYLRGVAALAVLLYHLDVQFTRLGNQSFMPDVLASGVDLFFVISGFIMWVTTQDDAITPLSFYRKRLVRVVPLYWIITSVIVVAALVLPGIVQSAQFDLWHVVASYLFLPYPSPIDGALNPILVPGWTLNYEMYFYAVFALTLLLPRKPRLYAVSALLLLIVFLGLVFTPETPALQFWTSTMLLEFLFGIAAGAVLVSGRFDKASWLGWAILIGGAVGLGFSEFLEWGGSRAFFFGVPCAAILFGAAILDRARAVPRWRVPKLLGDASYSIYLSHGLTLSAIGQVWHSHFPNNGLSNTAFSLVAILGGLLIGIAIHFAVEKPLIVLLGRRRQQALASS